MDPICDGYILKPINSKVRGRIRYSDGSVNFPLCSVSDSNSGATIVQTAVKKLVLQECR